MKQNQNWSWNKETNTLEPISTGLQPVSEKQFNLAKLKNAASKAKKHVPITNVKKSTARKPSNDDGSPEERFITLDDVKNVTLDVASELTSCELTRYFQESVGTNQFDELFALLLLYFDEFFKKVTLDGVEDFSTMEKKTFSMLTRYMEGTQKLLSEKYCALLLGLTTQKHHMACGKSRKSHTKHDRNFYENFYEYCCYLVWVTFRRKKDLKVIQAEIGRLFRSPAFNPHGRPFENKEFQRAYELRRANVDEISLKPMTTHNQQRPPITSLLQQRSPVLISLLPDPKDCTPWFLDRRTALPVIQKKEDGKDKLATNEIDLGNLKVGIIGENISGFNREKLTPFGTEAEDDKDSCRVEEEGSQ